MQQFQKKNFGFTLIEIIVLIFIAGILIILVVEAFARWNQTPSWYTYDPPNMQVPSSVVITAGPTPINPDVQNTYTLTVTYDNPIGTNTNYFVVAKIYENDFSGDVLLDHLVRLRFPAGATSASANFILICKDPDSNGNYHIVGDNGENSLDDEWEIFGYVKPQSTSYEEEGPSYGVSCEEP